MSTNLETRLRTALHDADVGSVPLDPGDVLALGHRARSRHRTRRTAVAASATLLASAAAAGVATVTVPAEGHPLSPLVWAAGPGPSAGDPTSMEVHGQRFRATMVEKRLPGERFPMVAMAALEEDGSTRELWSSSLDSKVLPIGGVRSSAYPGVYWLLFPMGTTDVQPVFATDVRYDVSTMTITSPYDGPRYLAVTIATWNPDDADRLLSYTWRDENGDRHTFEYPS